MNPYSIPPLMSAFIVILLGLYVVCRKESSTLQRRFFLVALCIFTWLSFFGLGYSMKNPKMALFLFRCAYLGVAFLPVTVFHFHLEFLNREEKKLTRFFYFVSAICVPISWTPYFFSETKNFFWGPYPQAGLLYFIFFIYFLPVLWAGPVKCFREAFIKKTANISPAQHKQLPFVVFSFFIANLGMVDFLAKLGFSIYPFGYINILIWCVVLAFAISHYNLLDVKFVADMVHSAKLAAIGTLAASINHEIRNPLYVIQGLAESHLINFTEGKYSEKEAIEKSNVILQKTVNQATRAMGIMRRFALFAKQSSIAEIEIENINLAEVLEDVLPLVQHELDLEKIVLTKNIPADLPPFSADRRHIEQILLNLIVNACQAVKSNEHPQMQGAGKNITLDQGSWIKDQLTMGNQGCIEISADRRNDHISILISDNGSGIASSHLDRIFDPFYTTKKKGTGLGLYITKQLVEKNGGTIRVKSQLRQGTQFHLEFKK
jgi:signal transduction histidine kinase